MMMVLLQNEFRWTNKTVRDVVLLVLVLPTLAYNAIVWRAHKDDEYGGRPKRLVSCSCAASRQFQLLQIQ
jgi:hypothetical protein